LFKGWKNDRGTYRNDHVLTLHSIKLGWESNGNPAVLQIYVENADKPSENQYITLKADGVVLAEAKYRHYTTNNWTNISSKDCGFG